MSSSAPFCYLRISLEHWRGKGSFEDNRKLNMKRLKGSFEEITGN
jgi:hypothetical protein